MRVSVLTISDSVAAEKAEDRSGPSVIARCRELGWTIASSAVCADDRAAIDALRAQVRQEVDAAVAWADERPYPDPATLLGGVYDGE